MLCHALMFMLYLLVSFCAACNGMLVLALQWHVFRFDYPHATHARSGCWSPVLRVGGPDVPACAADLAVRGEGALTVFDVLYHLLSMACAGP